MKSQEWIDCHQPSCPTLTPRPAKAIEAKAIEANAGGDDKKGAK